MQSLVGDSKALPVSMKKGLEQHIHCRWCMRRCSPLDQLIHDSDLWGWSQSHACSRMFWLLVLKADCCSLPWFFLRARDTPSLHRYREVSLLTTWHNDFADELDSRVVKCAKQTNQEDFMASDFIYAIPCANKYKKIFGKLRVQRLACLASLSQVSLAYRSGEGTRLAKRRKSYVYMNLHELEFRRVDRPVGRLGR